jgi:hypothetical protein
MEEKTRSTPPCCGWQGGALMHKSGSEPLHSKKRPPQKAAAIKAVQTQRSLERHRFRERQTQKESLTPEGVSYRRNGRATGEG